MRSGKSTCFSMVPFVPGSFYAKKPNAVELKMSATPQKSVAARNKSSGTGRGRGRGQARNKENIPNKSTGDRSRSSTHGRGGGQEVQEVICQCRELEKTAQIQKGTDCKDTSDKSLTVMMMMAAVSEAGQQVEEKDVDLDEEGQDEDLECWSTFSNTLTSLIWHLQDTRRSIFMKKPGRRLLLAWRVMVIDIYKLSLMSLSGK